MAASLLEIQPDLNKAPPHVEGDLLKQNPKAIVGNKGWRKYYFIVKSDKLQYYRKREDVQSNKDPVTYVRMSQVTEITEAVFTGVPKSHHLNCGFSIVSYHPVTQDLQTFNLLAETPEDMRYWVHALRYIKAYWSKMKIRDTVLSEEQERKLLEEILKEEEYERDDDLFGDYSLSEDGLVSTEEPSSRQISVFFANGSKVKVTLSTTQTTSDLLEMSEIKEHLNSSTAHIVLVDNVGKDTILDPKDYPALYQPKAHRFYAVEVTHKLLVIFIDRLRDFECVFVCSHATASDIIEHRDISLKLDVSGVANRGLFLKQKEGEQLFNPGESPCDVMFELGVSRNLKRLRVGQLVVKNKALGGGRSTARVTRRIDRTMKRPKRTISEEGRMLQQISEEEEAQQNALDMLLKKKVGKSKTEDLESTGEISIDGEIYVMPPDIGKGSRRNSKEVVPNPQLTLDVDEEKEKDDRGFNEAVIVGTHPLSAGRRASEPKGARPRTSAIMDANKLRSPTLGNSNRKSRSSGNSPSHSPASSPPRSRSKSPRRLPDIPAESSPRLDIKSGSKTLDVDADVAKGSPSALKRRGATRSGSVSAQRAKGGVSESGSPSLSWKDKGPTILLHDSEQGGVLPEKIPVSFRSSINKRPRSPSTRNTKFFENLNLGDSRSSAFGHTPLSPVDLVSSSLPSSNLGAPAVGPQVLTMTTGSLPVTSSFGSNSMLSVESDEDRLDKLLSRSFQQEQEEKSIHSLKPVDTLSAKVEAVVGGKKDRKSSDSSPKNSTAPLPMLIDFKALQSKQQAPPTSQADTESVTSAPSKPTATINVTSPSLLKVILLQSSEATDLSAEAKPMDFINLSGVCLRNDRGIWNMQEGYNYHDPLPFDCSDHTETFPLPGGIRVMYNHTHKRWHVFPPHASVTPSGDDSASVADSTEQSVDDNDSRQSSGDNGLYLSKKLIVTEVGTAFHHILSQFETTRDQAEKKKIGSDMINVAMGHVVRGEFCSAIAHILLDGLKRFRFEGLVQDDVWKVTVAFSNEAQSNPSSPLVYPAFDKMIFQPINSLKTVMRDSNIKFRTFVCLAMSKGMLTGFLEALPKQTSSLKKFYHPSAFLRLAAEHQPYQHLYQQMLLTLEPMVHLPFDLSIDFESRLAAERVTKQDKGLLGQEVGVVSGDGSDGSLSTSAEQSPPSTPVRPVVVIKTHAATGQRSTAGNVKSVVWETSPVHAEVKRHTAEDETDNSDHTSTLMALKEVQEKQLSVEQGKSTNLVVPLSQPQQVQKRSGPQAPTPSSANKRGPWWKKLSNSFQQLNAGGAITGVPKHLREQQLRERQRQAAVNAPSPTVIERHVKALYNNIADDADELNFMKDDVLVVNEQINEEWLICSLRGKSGIVPVNYVQPLC